jgi:Ca2+-binding RTX toxin-like protein
MPDRELGMATLIGDGGDNLLEGDGAWDAIYGLEGNDTLSGFGGRDTLEGREGDDVLDGGDGSDLIAGGLGDDTLTGGTGDDSISGGTGRDVIDAGAGYDHATLELTYAMGTLTDFEVVNLRSGVSQFTARDLATETRVAIGSVTGVEALNVYSGNGNDRIGGVYDHRASVILAGGLGSDTAVVHAQGSNAVLSGGLVAVGGSTLIAFQMDSPFSRNLVQLSGIEALDFRGGNAGDRIDGGNLADTLWGGGGNDRLIGYGGQDELRGGEGDDVLMSSSGQSSLWGGTGNDEFRLLGGASDSVYEASGGGTDTILVNVSYTLGENQWIESLRTATPGLTSAISLSGNMRDNEIVGNNGANAIYGYLGNDRLLGLGGSDTILGDGGNDLILGGGGADSLDGGYGDDTLHGNSGDTLYGGDGNDVYVLRDTDVTIIDGHNGGIDTILAGFDYTLADWHEVLVLSGSGNIDGTGGQFDNRIFGNAGDNRLSGGGGVDTLIGNGGSDTFVFTGPALSSSVDRVRGFGADDSFELDAGTVGLAAGDLDESAFVIGTAATSDGHRVIYDQATGLLYVDADGAGGAAQLLLARLDAGTALSADQFLLV